MSQFNPQPAWISASTAESESRVRAFVKSVYAWMFGGLLLTAFASMWVWTSPAMKQLIFGNRFMIFVLFGAMSVYGLATKRDLTSLGAFMFMGLIGLIIASIVSIFFHSPALQFAINVIGVVIFVGLTAWDTQKLKVFATASTGAAQESLAIYGALGLYLDFINLFLFLLRLFGNRRR